MTKFSLAILILLTTSLAVAKQVPQEEPVLAKDSGDRGGNGAQSIYKGDNALLRDIVEKDNCLWFSGHEIKKRFKKVKPIVDEITRVHWYYGLRIDDEISKLKFCVTERRLPPLSYNNSDDLYIFTNHIYDQPAINDGGVVFMDINLVKKMPPLHQGFLVIHEVNHEFYDKREPRSQREPRLRESIMNLHEYHNNPVDLASYEIMLEMAKMPYLFYKISLINKKEFQTFLTSTEHVIDREKQLRRWAKIEFQDKSFTKEHIRLTAFQKMVQKTAEDFKAYQEELSEKGDYQALIDLFKVHKLVGRRHELQPFLAKALEVEFSKPTSIGIKAKLELLNKIRRDTSTYEVYSRYRNERRKDQFLIDDQVDHLVLNVLFANMTEGPYFQKVKELYDENLIHNGWLFQIIINRLSKVPVKDVEGLKAAISLLEIQKSKGMWYQQRQIYELYKKGLTGHMYRIKEEEIIPFEQSALFFNSISQALESDALQAVHSRLICDILVKDRPNYSSRYHSSSSQNDKNKMSEKWRDMYLKLAPLYSIPLSTECIKGGSLAYVLYKIDEANQVHEFCSSSRLYRCYDLLPKSEEFFTFDPSYKYYGFLNAFFAPRLSKYGTCSSPESHEFRAALTYGQDQAFHLSKKYILNLTKEERKKYCTYYRKGFQGGHWERRYCKNNYKKSEIRSVRRALTKQLESWFEGAVQ